MACIKLWLKSGTSAKPNYMCSSNLLDICHFPRGSDQHYTIPCDHAVSDIAGHGKGSVWNAFCLNPDLIANIGKGDFHDETYTSYARSSSAGYSISSDEGSCDYARVVMFGKCKVPEALPPTCK